MTATHAEILVTDSVTKLGPETAGKVVIAGSHGGIYASYLAARAGAKAMILHDAGIGKDDAGIGSLDYLGQAGLPAAVVDHRTARIGNGRDMADNGVISHVNDAAAALGCAAGQRCAEAAQAMTGAAPYTGALPVYEEGRFVLREVPGEPRVVGCDSVSLVEPGDEGDIIVSASHGEVLLADPSWGNRPKVLAAVFNDAGADVAAGGGARLPDLDGLAIAGALVAADSARIGDARSAWETGVLSAVNQVAASHGARVGMSCQEFVELMIAVATGNAPANG